MDLKQIKQIIDLMKRSELTEFAVEEEGFKLKIRRGTNGLPVVSTARGSTPPFVPPSELAPPSRCQPPPSTRRRAPAATEETGVTYVKSPMVAPSTGPLPGK